MYAEPLSIKSIALADTERHPARAEARALTPGALLNGSLRLTRHLGAGGESDVYAAWDSSRRTSVAVKIARRGPLLDAEQRVRTERASLEAVRHPNLIRLLDACVSPGRCYLVLEALDPTPLSTRVCAAPLAPADAVRVICEVAGALDALHRKGWAHRDVKAENVLFGFDGRALLSDLGLACTQAESCAERSRSYGTPAYMAPELLSSAPLGFEVLCAADQYALGVTALLALTRSLPFCQESAIATYFAHLTMPTPRVSRWCPELARLDAPIARALSRDPADRFARVRDFADALADAFAG